MRSLVLFALLFCSSLLDAYSLFAEKLCQQPGYSCLSITRKDSWSQLFPDENKRRILQTINRSNLFLHPPMRIALPTKPEPWLLNDFSPLPKQLAVPQKKVLIRLSELAWGAYNHQGALIRWGAISPGTQRCLDPNGCETPVGSYRALRKEGADCLSKTHPSRMNGLRGGGEMPYCIFFYKGYALHGSSELPGYPASAGCVRLMIEDARWLNEQFISVKSEQQAGTLIELME
jgi:hypothetical protein